MSGREEQIEPSQVLRRGVVGVIFRQEKLLLIRRSQYVLAPGRFCFPGGGIEAGESDEVALKRELREELGVEVVPQRHLWSNVTPWGHALNWWLAYLAEDALPIPNPLEVESVHWHTLEEMAGLADLLSSNRDFLQALAQGEFSLPPLTKTNLEKTAD